MKTSDYEVLIQGEHVQDDGLRIELGKPTQDGSYSSDGGCGSFFDVEPEHGQVVLRRSKFS